MSPGSNIEWNRWAEADPLYGVASLEGRNKRGDQPWTEEEFYAHGERCWALERPLWEQYGIQRDSVVEIGCGAGRLTRPLSRYFGKAYGVDVAPAMLEIARRNVPSATFLQASGSDIPLPDGSVTAAFSCDVFQHFSSETAVFAYFREFFRVLQAGGTLRIHIPMFAMPRESPSWVTEGSYRMYRIWYEFKYGLRRKALQMGVGNPFMYGRTYSLNGILAELRKCGFVDAQVIFTNYRSYAMARKPEGGA